MNTPNRRGEVVEFDEGGIAVTLTARGCGVGLEGSFPSHPDRNAPRTRRLAKASRRTRGKGGRSGKATREVAPTGKRLELPRRQMRADDP